ncbi:MAG: spore coat protein [Clostridia bacterium]|nr:spore coat protein [Clostridia bacterium]MDE6613619.1 spore coat protein [Clostridia bacterium]
MKLTKMDCTLNEKDTLQDMLDAEKQLMSMYTTALFEGSTKSIRKSFSTNLLGVAENQYCIFNQMQSRGYYEPQPAKKPMIDAANDTFKKQKNSLKASG